MADELGIRTVLVANRGEIAVRIVRACHELGLRAVAVYSDADAGAPHVRMADEAHRIGPAPARASSPDVGALLGAARAAGADAVHPGYGLLSEDAGFAAAVVAAGMGFVGPSPEVIARMGDKVAARAVAAACEVPVPPGTGALDPTGDDAADRAAAVAAAQQVGWPLLVKASFGGGGRGMRVVAGVEELDGALAAAGREATAAFGRSEVHLERYLTRPRHVEVQVLADAHGTVLALGDRDCSVQRRHQKLVEEAPAPDLAPDLRAAMTDAALRIARHVGYTGAGTVEFLVAAGSGEHATGTGFFFLEMNTRLQVEHGVTELVTGVDLVAEQLRIADGRPLSPSTVDAAGRGPRGHAVQARIAVEDPREGFRPAPGRIERLVLPDGPGVRTDFGVTAGGTVPAEYDSMIGKVLAHAPDRDAARRRLALALDELVVQGPPTTAPYLRAVLATPEFASVGHHTTSVDRDWDPAVVLGPPPARPATDGPVPDGPTGAGVPLRRVRIATDRGALELLVPGRPASARRGAPAPARAGHTRTAPDAPATASSGSPVAPMDATVVAVRVRPGDVVAAGDVVAVLEAMKMEMEIRSGVAGTVTAVPVAVGSPVAAGAPLVALS